MRYASFTKRMNAYGVDVLLVQIFSALVMWQFAQFPTLEEWTRLGPETDHWLGQLTNMTLVFSAIYNVYFVSSDWQATPGKRWCGIVVVNADGSRLNLIQSALRHAASGLSTLFLGIGFLFALFTAEKTTLHDMLCKTRVAYKQ